MGYGYDEDDARDDTDATDREVSQAWHDARDDCQDDGDYGSEDWARDSDD